MTFQIVLTPYELNIIIRYWDDAWNIEGITVMFEFIHNEIIIKQNLKMVCRLSFLRCINANQYFVLTMAILNTNSTNMGTHFVFLI